MIRTFFQILSEWISRAKVDPKFRHEVIHYGLGFLGLCLMLAYGGAGDWKLPEYAAY